MNESPNSVVTPPSATRRALRHPLLRFLLFSFWFRLTLLAFLVLGTLVFLGVPAIWRTSPAGFQPIVKISGLDWLKSWSLQRTASKAMASGQTNEAIHAWGAASIHNPGNPDLTRGLLQALLQDTTKTNYVGAALQQAFWLLRLTHTNQTDLELTDRILEHYGLHTVLLQLLRPMEDRLSPTLAASYLKALFNSGQIDLFRKFWDQRANQLPNDPELPIYHAAYQAGWGDASVASNAWARLDAGQTDGSTRSLANHLEMLASFHTKDVSRFEASLKRSTDWKSVNLLDQLNYWRLLVVADQRPKAVKLAQAYGVPPGSPAETILLAEMLAELGLRKEARDCLANHAPRFADSQEVWLAYANLLLADQQWDSLVALASQIRQEKALHNALVGYSYYLEGRAELAKQHRVQAQQAFDKSSEYQFGNAVLAAAVAKSLTALGFPQTAKTLLLKYQAQLANNPEYWQAVYQAAASLKDETLLFGAAKEMFRLSPDSWLARYYYSAALITLRTQPDEAVKLTVQLPAQQPNSTGAKINHCLALALVGRVQEAETALKSIDPSKLKPNEATAYYLGLFQVHVNLRQFDQARQVSSHINREFLFPTEEKWFDNEMKQLSANPHSSSTSPLAGKPG
jgi:hypothetical protein